MIRTNAVGVLRLRQSGKFLFTVCDVSARRAETSHTDTDEVPCCRRQKARQCDAELLKCISPNDKRCSVFRASREKPNTNTHTYFMSDCAADRFRGPTATDQNPEWVRSWPARQSDRAGPP